MVCDLPVIGREYNLVKKPIWDLKWSAVLGGGRYWEGAVLGGRRYWEGSGIGRGGIGRGGIGREAVLGGRRYWEGGGIGKDGIGRGGIGRDGIGRGGIGRDDYTSKPQVIPRVVCDLPVNLRNRLAAFRS